MGLPVFPTKKVLHNPIRLVMALTQDQITQLFTFTRTHFVEHYDLQTELVDHLANGIEQTQQVSPSLSFQEALQLEFKKFGVCGFNDVVEERRKAMAKRYRQIIWRFFKEWFQLPRILTTLALFLSLFVIMVGLNNTGLEIYMFFGLLAAILIIPLMFLVLTRKNRELNRVRGGKKWMLSEFIYGLGQITQISNIAWQIGFHIVNGNEAIMGLIAFDIGFAAIMTVLVVFNYVILKIIPAKAEELLAETYPEYQMA